MSYGPVFNQTSKGYLELRPADGSVIIRSAFPTARIVGRREIVGTAFVIPGFPTEFNFAGPVENIDVLYDSIDTSLNWAVFYGVNTPVTEPDGTLDPTYSPTELNDTYVTYTSSSPILSGNIFKYQRAGDMLRIVLAQPITQTVSGSIDVTFTIPYFHIRNTGPGQDGKMYVSNLQITTSFTLVPLPPAIENVRDNNNADGHVDIIWDAPTLTDSRTIDSYKIEYTNALSDGTVISDGIYYSSLPGYIFTGLPSLSSLSLNISAIDSYAFESSKVSYDTTVAYYAPNPVITDAIVTPPSTVGIQWQQDGDTISSFNLYLYSSNGGTYTSQTSIDSTVRDYILTDIQPGTYSAQIETLFTDGSSKLSTIRSEIVVPDSTPAAVITDVTVSGSTVTVQWSHDGGISYFNVYLTPTNGDARIERLTVDQYMRSINISALDGTYTVEMETMSPYGTLVTSTPWASEITVAGGGGGGGGSIPVITSVTSVANDSIQVDWMYSGVAVAFNVYWIKAGITFSHHISDPTATTYTITGLDAGYYAIQIGAVDDQGGEAGSDLSSAVSVVGGGGGGGGGGGNNGGNGYNNMASLTFNPAFRVDATDATNVTIYGETAVDRPEYNVDIAVSVSKTLLDEVLSFSKNGEAAATDFSVDLSGIASAVSTALASKLQELRPRPSLADMGIDDRSILSVTHGAWAANDTDDLETAKTDGARNVYEQAADKGKLSVSEGKLNLAVGDQFIFFMDTAATQSVEITIDGDVYSGASTSDVAPLIPLAALFGASNAAGDKGTISKTWDYKFKVTVTATA